MHQHTLVWVSGHGARARHRTRAAQTAGFHQCVQTVPVRGRVVRPRLTDSDCTEVSTGVTNDQQHNPPPPPLELPPTDSRIRPGVLLSWGGGGVRALARGCQDGSGPSLAAGWPFAETGPYPGPLRRPDDRGASDVTGAWASRAGPKVELTREPGVIFWTTWGEDGMKDSA